MITYIRLIQHFWTLHYPKSVDLQGADVGVKYRLALFFNSVQQARLALGAKLRLDASGKLSKTVATVILPLG
ncbi:peptide-methionine (S)-S-oxide reductase [Pseudomonas sp. GB2N2]